MLITTVLLMAAPLPVSEAKTARKAFYTCLQAYAVEAAKANVPVDSFTTEIETKCSVEAEALKAEMLATDKKFGMKQADTIEAWAADIADYRQGFVEEYTDSAK